MFFQKKKNNKRKKICLLKKTLKVEARFRREKGQKQLPTGFYFKFVISKQIVHLPNLRNVLK